MIKAENQKKRKPFTAQDTIPYKEIYKDGICRTDDNYYSKMVQFYDINYQLAQNDDKAAIFENYCEFLNSFDSSVEVQITFLNQQVNFDEYAKNIDIPEQDDCFNDIRKEYSDMLKMQLSKGNNGLVKTKSISSNCSVYVRVTDQNGNTYEQNRYIECFDKTKPTIIAAAKNGILIVQGVDAESGIAALYVNGNEFTELTNNTLNVRLQKADTSYEYFTLQAKDKAGNMSEIYKVGNPYYENPDAVKENTEVSGTEQNAASLPADGTASKPTSATATVTEHQTTNETATAPTEPENTGNETDTEADTGRVQGESSASGMTTGTVQDKGGKEFYTIKTKSDKVFYLIVDKDKTDENVYLLTEVGENDLLNFTDTNMVTLPQNQAIAESALPLETEKLTETPEPEVTIIPEEKEEPEKKSNNSGTILLMLLVLAGVCGAYYYWKFMKGRNTSFDYEEDEDDDEEEEDTIREDDEELEEYEMEGEVEDEESEE